MSFQQALRSGPVDNPVQKAFNEEHLNSLPTIHILDVGAMAEGEERYHALVKSGKARVTGFEPNVEQFLRLQNRPGPYRYVQAFLGNGGPATFHITRW
ncbi:MAG: hypothetical protein H7039_02015, partial [Bryobacteraceae bacterium]|nr:hypothetical protein [Bryobacteraceae bacterium]